MYIYTYILYIYISYTYKYGIYTSRFLVVYSVIVLTKFKRVLNIQTFNSFLTFKFILIQFICYF